MNRVEEIKAKLIEDFWVSRLGKFTTNSLHYDSVRSVDANHRRVSIVPDEVCVQSLERISYGKQQNKLMFLILCAYIWARRFTGDASHLIGAFIPGDDVFSKLVFLDLEAIEFETVRSFLGVIHKDISTVLPKALEGYKSVCKRIDRLADGKDNMICDFGIGYNERQIEKAEQSFRLFFHYNDLEREPCLSVSMLYETNQLPSPEQIAKQYCFILKLVCNSLDSLIKELNILTPEDLIVLKDINNTGLEYPVTNSVLDKFQMFSEQQPERPAVICGGNVFSFGEVDSISDRLAQYLMREFDIAPYEKVGLILGHSEWRIFGILAILKCGAAYVPIKSDFPVSRIRFMLEDCGCRIFLTEKCFGNAGVIDGFGVRPVLIEDLPVEGAAVPRIRIDPRMPFVVLYTSGSSGNPKGVVLSHLNMIDRLHGEVALYKLDEKMRTIQTSNYAFDSSLLELFLPFAVGGVLVIPTESELQDYHLLSNVISGYGITDLQANPNFLRAFSEYCWANGNGNHTALRRIWSGGESLNNALVKLVKATFPSALISNHYGPTEGTVDALVNVDIKEFDRNIIGRPIFNMNVFIVDAHLNIQPVDFPGEICISGVGLAHEYLNLPELTKERFVEHPAGGSAKCYRTGDLGRILPTGVVEYLGRIDDQVKIRGYRIEPGEVEKVMMKSGMIKDAAVLSRVEKDGSKYLVAFTIWQGKSDVAGLKKWLQKELPDFMVPSFILPIERFPLTTAVKVDKKALDRICEKCLFVNTDMVTPKDEVEERLLELWREVFPGRDISTTNNFFEIGGQSLKAITLIFKVSSVFRVKMELRDLFAHTTIIDQAIFIRSASPIITTTIPRTQKSGYFAATNAQERLWIICQNEALNRAYNLTEAYVLEGEVNVAAFEATLQIIAERHEIIRTRLVFHGDALCQYVEGGGDSGSRFFSFNDVRALADNGKQIQLNAVVRKFSQLAFDLAKGPLILVDLLHYSDNKYYLFFAMHHIVSDEWSMEVLIEEFFTIYDCLVQNVPVCLNPLPVQYKDYAEWKAQDVTLSSRSKRYWLDLLEGPLPKTMLPADFDRGTLPGKEGRYRQILDGELTSKIKQLALGEEATDFMVMLAIFNVLLSKITGSEDIIIGTITSGRNYPELDSVIGLFVNTVVMRNKPQSECTFRTFLKQVRERSLDAYSHQDYEFDDLVQALNVSGKVDGTPIFNILFEFQNEITLKGNGFSVSDFEYEHLPTAKFDLTLSLTASENSISILWTYDSALYRADTIETAARLYLHVIEIVLEDSDLAMGRLQIVSAESAEARQVQSVAIRGMTDAGAMFDFSE